MPGQRPLAVAALIALSVVWPGIPRVAWAEKPAIVAGARPESELATITLTSSAETRLRIETQPVEKRLVARTRSVGGECMPPPGHAVSVDAPFAGVILPGSVDGTPAIGSAVDPGQPILRLVPLLRDEADLATDSASEVASAEARVEYAKARSSRVEQMLGEGTISKQDADIAREQLAVAMAELGAAQARARRVGESPVEEGGGLVLSAPRASILQEIHVSAGQTVAAGSPLFDVISVEPLWVRVSLYAGDLARFGASTQASVMRLGGPGERWAAQRIKGPLSADPLASSVDLYFELANDGAALRPGERVIVELPFDAQSEALVVPWSAILYDIEGGTWVYTRPEPNVYRRRRVELRNVTDGWAVLARGPEVGTPVVTAGAAELFGTEFGVGK